MPSRGALIPKTFFLRPVAEVARDLLGLQLCRGEVLLRITEVEAYGGAEDSASHCRSGPTARNAPMWREGGRAYVYLCYGMHHLLNLVTGPEGSAGAVLIRSCEPLAGLETIRQRRGGLQGPALLTGPGKVAQALALDLTWNDHLLYEPDGLELRDGDPPEGLLAGTRVGVDYASAVDRAVHLRFAAAGTSWVSRARALRRLEPCNGTRAFS